VVDATVVSFTDADESGTDGLDGETGAGDAEDVADVGDDGVSLGGTDGVPDGATV